MKFWFKKRLLCRFSLFFKNLCIRKKVKRIKVLVDLKFKQKYSRNGKRYFVSFLYIFFWCPGYQNFPNYLDPALPCSSEIRSWIADEKKDVFEFQKKAKKKFTLFFFSFLGYSKGRVQLTPHSSQNLSACPVLLHAFGLLPVSY